MKSIVATLLARGREASTWAQLLSAGTALGVVTLSPDATAQAIAFATLACNVGGAMIPDRRA